MRKKTATGVYLIFICDVMKLLTKTEASVLRVVDE